MMAEASAYSFIPDLIKSHPVGTHLPKDLDKAITITAILVCILGLIANSIIFCLLGFMIKKTKITTYFQNMIVANIFLVIFSLFFHCRILIVYKPGDTSMLLSRLMVMLLILGNNTNFYIFTVICVSRFLIVFFPAWRQHHRLDNVTVIMCVIVWLLSTLVSLVGDYSCYPRHQTNIHDFLFRCRASSLFKIIFELLLLLPVMIFCAFALCVRMQKNGAQTPAAGIDISIVVTALVFLFLDSPVRASHEVLPWNQMINVDVLIRIFMFSRSISNSTFPFVFFFVGVWKRQAREPFFMYLERAFMEEGNNRPTTETDEEEA